MKPLYKTPNDKTYRYQRPTQISVWNSRNKIRIMILSSKNKLMSKMLKEKKSLKNVSYLLIIWITSCCNSFLICQHTLHCCETSCAGLQNNHRHHHRLHHHQPEHAMPPAHCHHHHHHLQNYKSRFKFSKTNIITRQ